MGTRASYESGTFCWTDLATTDGPAATSFYTGVFGWEAHDQPAGDAGAYTMLRVGDHDVAALFQASSRATSRVPDPGPERRRRRRPAVLGVLQRRGAERRHDAAPA